MTKYHFSGNLSYIGLFLLSLLSIYGCSSVPEVTSYRNSNEIVVDGKQQDWGNNFISVKGQNVAVAFLVYELKIPLTKNKEFTQIVFKANPNDEIKVKFESNKIQNKNIDNDREENPRDNGGGMEGHRGRGGYSGDIGNRRGGASGNNDPIDYEFKVKLSSL
jgi:hypothetical protein